MHVIDDSVGHSFGGTVFTAFPTHKNFSNLFLVYLQAFYALKNIAPYGSKK